MLSLTCPCCNYQDTSVLRKVDVGSSVCRGVSACSHRKSVVVLVRLHSFPEPDIVDNHMYTVKVNCRHILSPVGFLRMSSGG